MPYRRTARADDDYFAIYRYGVERYGEAQAEDYADRLDAAFDMLASFPFAARVRHEVGPPVRAHPVGVHLVIYEIDPGGDILILRIFHARSDWIND